MVYSRHETFAGGKRMLKVLIAEDDLMIADMVEECLSGSGYEVCGIARTVTEGVALGRLNRPDLAILDMRLADGGLGPEIAAQLKDGARIGILYASGNIGRVIDLAGGDACIAKPYHPHDLLRALKIIEQIVCGGMPSAPFPRGFQLLGANQPTPGEAAYV
jgi:DNA-binding response OmpR family regulator